MKDIITCDICGKMAIDKLKPEFQPNDVGVVDLCSDHAYEVYKFECDIIAISRTRLTNGSTRIAKTELTKAKIICMNYGLDMKVTEHTEDKAWWIFW